MVRMLILAGLSVWAAGFAGATTLEGAVRDSAGRPVADAVIYAMVPGKPQVARQGAGAVMDQVDKEFVPYVLPVQVGTLVRFPNQDNIRHNVYSFSPAKVFSLQLYRGTTAEPVLFDKPGGVVLGCNIHDLMLGYILAVETPHFGVTNAGGKVGLSGIAAGEYEVRVWHPQMQEMPDAVSRRVSVSGTGATPVSFMITLKPDPRKKPKR